MGRRCCTWAFSSAFSSPCGGFSREAQALGSRASVVAVPGLSSRGSLALEHRFS